LKDIIESCFRMQGGALNYYIGILSDVLTSCEDTFAKEEQLRIIKEQEIQKSKEVEKTEKPKENGPNGIESNKIKAIVRLDNALRLFRETHHQHGNYKELVQELV